MHILVGLDDSRRYAMAFICSGRAERTEFSYSTTDTDHAVFVGKPGHTIEVCVFQDLSEVSVQEYSVRISLSILRDFEVVQIGAIARNARQLHGFRIGNRHEWRTPPPA